MPCYFITGGNGNLARQLAAALVNDGNKVVLFDITQPLTEEGLRKCTFVTGDMTDLAGLREMMETHRPEYICHMASLLSGSSEGDRRRAWAVNAHAGYELLEMALDLKVKCFFFPSTAATYGPMAADPLPEDFQQWPENFYGATKVAIERIGCYFHYKHGLNFRSVRLPFVISRHAPAGALTAYASHAFVRAALGQDVSFPVSPDAAVSTIYVKDVTAGILKFIHAPDTGLTRRVYNLHSFAPTALEIAGAIQKRIPGFKYTFDPNPDAVRLTNGLPAMMDDATARSDWGWNPQYNLERMTDDFLQELIVRP